MTDILVYMEGTSYVTNLVSDSKCKDSILFYENLGAS